MTSFAKNQDPGVRILWCLRRRTTDVRCVLCPGTDSIELQVLQDRDLVIKEVFLHELDALNWAEEYSARLKAHGWRDSPEDVSPSSVA